MTVDHVRDRRRVGPARIEHRRSTQLQGAEHQMSERERKKQLRRAKDAVALGDTHQIAEYRRRGKRSALRMHDALGLAGGAG